MRLDRYLSNMGLGSRKDVKKLLLSGEITVDGREIRDASYPLREGTETVCARGREIAYRPFVYIMVNKPAGYISSTEDGSGPVVTELLGEEFRSYKLGVAGRLDKDAEGLLLLTNDGPFIHRIISPEKHIVKKYFTLLKKPVEERDIEAFKNGIVLRDGTRYKSALLVSVASDDGFAALTCITEGKFHQVKKMFAASGNEVLYLRRISIGGLGLDPALEKGAFRELGPEVAAAVFGPEYQPSADELAACGNQRRDQT